MGFNWKKINDNYMVSDCGKVKSLDRLVDWNGTTRLAKGKILSPLSHPKGYLQVRFAEGGRGNYSNHLIHRLVAIHFVPNPSNLPQVNHIDGNKQNNHYTNLEWVNNSDNQKHANSTGLRVSPKGDNHWRRR